MEGVHLCVVNWCIYRCVCLSVSGWWTCKKASALRASCTWTWMWKDSERDPGQWEGHGTVERTRAVRGAWDNEGGAEEWSGHCGYVGKRHKAMRKTQCSKGDLFCLWPINKNETCGTGREGRAVRGPRALPYTKDQHYCECSSCPAAVEDWICCVFYGPDAIYFDFNTLSLCRALNTDLDWWSGTIMFIIAAFTEQWVLRHAALL